MKITLTEVILQNNIQKLVKFVPLDVVKLVPLNIVKLKADSVSMSVKLPSVMFARGESASRRAKRCAKPRVIALSTERITWPPSRPTPGAVRSAPAAFAAFAITQ